MNKSFISILFFLMLVALMPIQANGLSPENIQNWVTEAFTPPNDEPVTEQEPIILILWLSTGLIVPPLPLPLPMPFTLFTDLNPNVDDTSGTSFEKNSRSKVVIELKPETDDQGADEETADGRREIVVRLERVNQDDAQEASVCGNSTQRVPERTFITAGKVTGLQLELMIKWGKIMFNVFNQVILESLKNFSDALVCYDRRTWGMAMVNPKTGQIVVTNQEISNKLAQAAEDAEAAEEQERAQQAVETGDGVIKAALTAVPSETQDTQDPIVLVLAVKESAKKSKAQLIIITELLFKPQLFKPQLAEITIPDKQSSFSVKLVSGNIFKFIWNCVRGVCKILGLPTDKIMVRGVGSSERLVPTGTYTVSMTNSDSEVVARYIVSGNGAAPTATEVVTPVVTEVDGVSQPPQTRTDGTEVRPQ